MSFFNGKRFAISVGCFGIFGFLTWLALLPLKLIFKDKLNVGSAMTGVGLMSGLALLMASFSKNEAQIDAFDEMIENM